MGGCDDTQCQLFEDYTFENNKMSASWDEIIDGTGTSEWIIDGYVEMKVPVQNDRVVRQSKQYFLTKTGKFKKCLFTMVLNLINDNGYTSRIGSFDDDNDKTVDSGGSGIFFEYTNDILYLGIRYGTVDNGTDTLIAQSDFNVNDLMRNSHINILEWTKIYTFEVLFSDTGRVEWAIFLDGERILLHKIQDITRILNILPRFTTPLRVEIKKNDNDIGTTIGEMRQFNTSICYQCECGGDGDNNKFCTNKIKHLSALTNIAFNLISPVYRPLFSFKLKDAYIRMPVYFYEILYLVQKKGPFMFAIVKNSTFTDLQPVWVDPGSGCNLEYDITANEIDLNNLNIIYEEFVDSNCHSGTSTQDSLISDHFCFPPISSDISGDSDIITIVAKKKKPSNVVLNFNVRWIFEC